MKCVLISCFNAYDQRIRPIETFLRGKGYDCEYITSDFNHRDKTRYIVNRDRSIQISVLPYYKNLSIRRLMSHYIFAKKAIKEVKRIQPDLLYVMLPPNSLARFATHYKKKNKVKLVYDLYDLWPETIPFKNFRVLMSFPFSIWRGLRDRNLQEADVVITECNLYQDILQDVLVGTKTKTIYPLKQECRVGGKPILDRNIINLCYLGSINNIIDIPSIVKLVNAINKMKPTVVHIIGDGESKDNFIKEIISTGARVEYYGKIFDQNEKQKIFDKCHFGLNIMKDTVCVGLTLKSLDYFHAGLPIINNIKADTTEIVDLYKTGFNITDKTIENIAKKIVNIDIEELMNMRVNTTEVYDRIFSSKEFYKRMEEVFGI
jgi:glycosyltransferase involved in cell wall biosynthesis